MIANGNIGLNGNQNHSQGGKISTRVLAPPGGGSSISFGGGGYSAPMPTRNKPPAQSSPKKQAYGSGYVGTVGRSADDMNYKKFKNQFQDCLQKPEINRSPRLQNRRMRDSLDDEMNPGKSMPSPLRYGNAPNCRHDDAPPRRGGRNDYAGNDYGGGNDYGAKGYEQRGYNGGYEDVPPPPRQSSNGPMGKEAYAQILKEQIMANKGVDTGRKIGRKQEDFDNPYNRRDSRQVPKQAVVGGRRGAKPSAAQTSFSLGWD